MANLKLVSSEYNSVALYYILTSIDDVATNGAVIDGNVPLVSGALAYDRNMNIYAYDGTMWNKSDASVILPAGTLISIANDIIPATVTTMQYPGYQFGTALLNSVITEDPFGYTKLYVCFDGAWYELDKNQISWGTTVFYFGAEASGTYPQLEFDFSEYPFAIADLAGDTALVVGADASGSYDQTHSVYAFVYLADS